MNFNALMSTGKDDWETPQHLFDAVNTRFGPFTVDAAANKRNTKCERFWDKWGAERDWTGERIWCNPPYSRSAQKWFIAHAAKCEADIAVLLVPSRTDTIAWHKYIMASASKIFFVKGRITFVGAEAGAPFPSALVVFERSGRTGLLEVETWR